MALSFLRLLLIFCFWYEGYYASESQSTSRVILDVSQVIKDGIENNKPLAWETLKAIALANKATDTSAVMFYEIDLRKESGANLKIVGQFLTELQREDPAFELKLLLSFKNAKFDEFIKDRDYANNVLEVLKDFSPLFMGISFESGIAGNFCVQNTNNSLNFIEKFKNEKTSPIAPIGYAVTLGKEQCGGSHIEPIKQADYIIINVPLKVNDKIFVESFGIFKKNMETLIDSVRTSKSGEIFVNKTVYYRISLNAALNRAVMSTDSSSETKEFRVTHILKDTQILEEAIPQLNKDNEITSQRYEQLLTNYIYEWIANTNDDDDDLKIILTFTHGYPVTNYADAASAWMQTHTKIIPFLARLDVSDIKGNNASNTISANILLEEIATSGFHTVMMNGQIWKKLLQYKDHQQCQNYYLTKCRPSELIYRIDENLPFGSPANSTYLQLMRSLGKMRMEALQFEHNHYEGYRKEIKEFHIETEADSKKPSTGRFLCETWSGSLQVDCNENCTDSIVKHQHHAYDCGSPSSLTDGFVWSVTINLNDEMETFVETTMMRLDAFVIARRAPQIKYPARNVVLHVKCMFFGGFIKSSMYCNSLAKRLGQFYDAILTWARIHDFPVIMEQLNDSRDVGNPLAFEKITTTGESSGDPLYELMDKIPIFVRRSYNESKVFGTWTEGMYPCIVKKSSISGFSFDQEFSGVTVNLNLRQDNDSLITSGEVQTLLLLTLQKFQKIEVILEHDHFQVLYDAVSVSSNFEKILKENGIGREKKIYFQIQSPFSEDDQENLNNTVRVLKKLDFKVYITLAADMVDQIDKFDNTFKKCIIGMEQSSCSGLAYDTVHQKDLNIKENLGKLKYLVCDMPPVPANNQDEEKMQNYFNSHLYLKKLLQHAYPKIEQIHFRLHSIFNGNTSWNQSKDLLLFLSDLNNYAYSYKIHYFLVPAFAKENDTETETSLWDITNYDKLADPSVFNDRIVTVMGEDTWRPKFQNDEHSSESSSNKDTLFGATFMEMLCGLGSVILIIIATAVAAVLVKRRIDQTFLSDKEIQDFMNGRQETLREATRFLRRKKRFSGSIFDGLVFQKEYALAKEDLDMNSKIILAQGKYSTVYKVKFKDSLDEVAVKVSNRNCSKEIFKGMLSEVKLLCYLGDHRNIVSFLGCYKREINRGVLWVVMEFRDGGNLLSYLKGRSANEREEQSLQELIRFSHEIASGMEHIADQNIVHGDLCAENILMNRYNKCKIKCFGLSRKQQEYYVHMKKNHMEKIAAWRWMAPESLNKLEFTKQSDVWSFAVTLWEIFTLGELPHSGVLRVSKLIENVENGIHLKIPDYATEEIYNVMLECWRIEPDRRPDFTRLLNYFTQLMPQNTEKDVF